MGKRQRRRKKDQNETKEKIITNKTEKPENNESLQSSETSPFELTPDISTTRGTKSEKPIQQKEICTFDKKAADKALPGDNDQIRPEATQIQLINENLVASLSDAIFDEPITTEPKTTDSKIAEANILDKNSSESKNSGIKNSESRIPENLDDDSNRRALEVFQKLFNQPPDLSKLPSPQAPLKTDVFEVENFMPKGISLTGDDKFDSRPMGCKFPAQQIGEKFHIALPKTESSENLDLVKIDDENHRRLKKLEISSSENDEKSLEKLDSQKTVLRLCESYSSLPDLEDDFGNTLPSIEDAEKHREIEPTASEELWPETSSSRNRSLTETHKIDDFEQNYITASIKRDSTSAESESYMKETFASHVSNTLSSKCPVTDPAQENNSPISEKSENSGSSPIHETCENPTFTGDPFSCDQNQGFSENNQFEDPYSKTEPSPEFDPYEEKCEDSDSRLDSPENEQPFCKEKEFCSDSAYNEYKFDENFKDPDHIIEPFAENDQNDLNDPYAQNDPYGSFENSGNFRSAHDQSPEINESEYDRLLDKSKNSEPELEKFEYQKFSSRRSSSSSVESFESKTFDRSDTTSSEILPCSNSQLTNDFKKSAEAKSIENHAEKLIEALYNMQKKGIGCDFTLVSSEVQNCHVTLHSFVLQEFSTFLLPKGQLKVSLNLNELSMLVDFIYSGKLYLSVKNIDAYLKISKTFESIPIIEKTMLKFLGQSATDDNLIEILNLAEKYDQMNLRDEILGKITNDVEKFHGEILKMNLANFSELLSRDDLNVENETQVVALLKDWISAQDNIGDLSGVLAAIRFSCLDPAFIVSQIASDKVFGGTCSQMVMKGMSYHLLPHQKFENSICEKYPRKSKECIMVIGSNGIKNSPLRYKKGEDWIPIDTSNFPLLNSISGHQVISKNGFIFIIGGEMIRQNERKGTPSASVFCLDSRLNLLTELAPMKSARVHFSATEVDGKIYVFGGRNETGILRDCEVLEIRSNTWSKIRSLLKPRCCHAASRIGSDILVSGGYVQESSSLSKYSSSILTYDTKCNLWQDAGNLEKPRGWHQMISVSNAAYVLAGCYQGAGQTGRIPIDTIEMIRCNREISVLPVKLLKYASTPGVFSKGNKIILTGGWDETKRHYSTACQEIDLENFSIRYSMAELPANTTVHHSILSMF